MYFMKIEHTSILWRIYADPLVSYDRRSRWWNFEFFGGEFDDSRERRVVRNAQPDYWNEGYQNWNQIGMNWLSDWLSSFEAITSHNLPGRLLTLL